jgi:uncharacterized membrane protein YphA (DoxX/SURF4 family)
VNYEKISEEFHRWGYPFPQTITIFLIFVWILSAPFLLIPSKASGAAMILLVFMLIAFFTLVVHKEWRRLWQPAIPIVLLAIVALGRSHRFEISSVLKLFFM